MGQQQRGCEVRKVHLVRTFIAREGCEPLPAFERLTVTRGFTGRLVRGLEAGVLAVLSR